MAKILLGFDLGSSSVKVSAVDAETGKSIGAAAQPEVEMPMISIQPGWAEQEPELWWTHAVNATKQLLTKANIRKDEIIAIGISYQMHGLVLVDKNQHVLRPSIIWCDSRAVQIGEKASQELGDYASMNLLNSPGNFTASKLKWVKENEPQLFDKIHKFMLPGDFLAMKLTGEICTTASGLSEGIFWDFISNCVSEKLLMNYGFSSDLIPSLVPAFSLQGKVSKRAADELGIAEGTPITYRAGDQPNNAFSLKALHPGEVAATAGTSGVIYGVSDQPIADKLSRVNTFLHVSNTAQQPRYGVLLCVNGTGIMNSWLRKLLGSVSYPVMNKMAEEVEIGSDGLAVLPFGNGAERIFQNKNIGASIHGLDLNRHSSSHVSRAVQEGIVFALAYGFSILNETKVNPSVIRAGNANMFLSPVFREAFVNTIGARLELFDTDGAQGAAIAAGLGVGFYKTEAEAFRGLTVIQSQEPEKMLREKYLSGYRKWSDYLANAL
jgi:xylulokinase